MGAKFLPGGSVSHDMPAETRAAMQEQRRGEHQGGVSVAPTGFENFGGEVGDIDLGSAAAPGQDWFTVSQLGSPEEQLNFVLGNEAATQSGSGVSSGATSGFEPMVDVPPSGMEVTPGGAAGGGLGAGVGGALSSLGGAYGLYQGLQKGNPVAAGFGAAGTAQGLNQISGAAGGPALGGLAGNVAGPVLGGLAGAYGLYSGIKNEQPVEAVAGGLGMVGGGLAAANALAGGAAAGGLMGAGTGATVAAGGLGAIGGAATGLGAVLAVGMIVNQLVQSGILPGNYKPTPSDISKIMGTAAAQNLARELPNRLTLPQMSQMLNTQMSPHGEAQFSSTGAQTPQEWQGALGLLNNPEALAQGQGVAEMDPFIRGLGFKYGETGTLNQSDPETDWRMKQQMIAALPERQAYQGLRTDFGQGGSEYAQEQARLDAQQSGQAARTTTPMQDNGFGNMQAAPSQNQWDPYTGRTTTPDGRMFLLSPQLVRDYNINPYTFVPDHFDDNLYSAGTPAAAGYDQATGKNFDSRGWEITPEGNIPPTPPEIGPYSMQRNTPFQAQANPYQSTAQPQAAGGMEVAAAPEPQAAPVTGDIDPGVSVAGAGKRSPTFATPELDNRAEAMQAGMTGKVPGQTGQDGDQGVPFGMAGKRAGPQGGMQVGGPRPGGGRPGGQAPFGGVPRGGMMPQASGGRPQPNMQRRSQGTV